MLQPDFILTSNLEQDQGDFPYVIERCVKMAMNIAKAPARIDTEVDI